LTLYLTRGIKAHLLHMFVFFYTQSALQSYQGSLLSYPQWGVNRCAINLYFC